MMIEPSDERRPPITPQLALRVAIFGVIAFALFAIVFFRLWYLQVLSGDQYLAEANHNRVRELRIQAPRGEIVDRNGTVIVTNKRAIVVQLDPSKLPDERARRWPPSGARTSASAQPSRRAGAAPKVPIPPIPTADLRERFERLGQVVDTSADAIHRQVIRSLAVVPYSDVRLKTDVPTSVLNYLREREEHFPGVTVEQTYLRDYPRDELAAQLFGTVGEVTPEQLKQERFRGVTQGTVVGQDGLERAYDRYLRGRDGVAARAGRRARAADPERPPARHRARGRPAAQALARLDLQRAGQRRPGRPANPGNSPGARSWRWTRATARSARWAPSPSFDPDAAHQADHPEAPTTRCSARRPARRSSTARSPGLYPTGSTFKPITALAALRATARHRRTSRSTTRAASRSATASSATPATSRNGPVDLRKALQVSSDVYFYALGERRTRCEGRGPPDVGAAARARPPDRHRPARRVRRASSPTRKWRERTLQDEIDCRKRKKMPARRQRLRRAAQGLRHLRHAPVQDRRQRQPLGRPGRPAGHAAADGGRLLRRSPTAAGCVRPHLGLRGRGRPGPPGPAHRAASAAAQVKIDPANRAGDPRRPAARRPEARRHLDRRVRGLAARPLPGLRQDRHRRAPAQGRPVLVRRLRRRTRPGPIVVAVTVEKGGFGAETAAPIARLILSECFEPAGRSSSRASRRTLMNEPVHQPAVARGLRLPFDPLLAARRASGCCVASLVHAARRDRRRRPRRPDYYVAAPGRLLRRRPGARRAAARRIDYSRLRELKYGLYGAADRRDPARHRVRRRDARLAPRDRAAVLPLPGRPSWARCC